MAAPDPAGGGARGAIPRHSRKPGLFPAYRRGGVAGPMSPPAAVGEVSEIDGGEGKLCKYGARVEAASGVGAPAPADGFEAAGLAEAVLPSPATPAARSLAAYAETGAFGLPEEVSGEGALAPAGVLEATRMADAALASCDSPTPVQRPLSVSATRGRGESGVGHENAGVRKATEKKLPGFGSCVVSTPKSNPHQELGRKFSNCTMPIELSRKWQYFEPRVVAHHVSSGKNWPVADDGNNITGTLRKNRLHSGSKDKFSSLRFWIIILLLSCGVNSVNGQICAANQNICPAPTGQFKRILQGDFFKSGEAICKECGLEKSGEKKSECKEIRGDETIARVIGTIFMFLANAGPIVAVKRISEVTPHRKQMLCYTSASFATSSFLWLVYFSPEDCLNWPSYISLAIASSFHGYFCWFFWQQTYGSISLQSFAAFIGSCILSSAAAFISRTQSFVDMSTTSKVAGVLAVAFTVLAIYNRRHSTGPRPDGYLDINVICAFIGTASFLYCIKWRDYELNKLSYQLILFKFGAILLSILRVCEVCELCWFYCMRDRASSGEHNVPLLEPGIRSDSAGTTSTTDAGGVLPPTDTRNVSETPDGTNRGNATNGLPGQNGETGGLGPTEPNAENFPSLEPGIRSDSAGTTSTTDAGGVLPPTDTRNVSETPDGTNRGNATNGLPGQNGEAGGLGPTEPNAENFPSLEPGIRSDGAGTTSTTDAGGVLPPTDTRNFSETPDGTNRGNATNGLPGQNGEAGGLGPTEPNAENSNGGSPPNTNGQGGGP